MKPDGFLIMLDGRSVSFNFDQMQLGHRIGFTVATDFPKIIKSHLPLGIYDTSYSIELSAVEKFILEPEKILQQI